MSRESCVGRVATSIREPLRSASSTSTAQADQVAAGNGAGPQGPTARCRCLLDAQARADTGAVVPLLDLVPPTLALVLDHRGLFDEDAHSEPEDRERLVCASDGREELPPERRSPPRSRRDVGCSWTGSSPPSSTARESRVRRALIAEKLSVTGVSVSGRAGCRRAWSWALRLRADGLDLVAEEVMRTGRSCSGPYTSMMLPRIATCPHLDDVDACSRRRAGARPTDRGCLRPRPDGRARHSSRGRRGACRIQRAR